jgi:hypothetical protein
MKRCFVSFLVVSLVAILPLLGQNISATLTGTVLDQAGAVIPGADIKLTNQATGVSVQTASNEVGIFVFTSLLPATYTLEVGMPGFRTLTMREIVLNANERRSLGNISLQVGEVEQRVEVTAEASYVQTASSERAGLISGDQVLKLAVKGRDFLGLMSTLPGVLDTNVGSREVVMTGNVLNGLHINGGRTNSVMYALDGISSVDTGSNSSVQNAPNMDAISEVKVLTSNYQAEYGRNSSGTINVIMKGGTRDFHGSVYWYYRDKSLNANSFFNNRSGTAKDDYHFNNAGYSIGGPIYIPGKFNTNKDKLFFFFSQEYVRRRLYLSPRFVTTPTELERNGDFSQTLDTNGKVIKINDPLDGKKQFPNNAIPANRINPVGKEILNFFPLPNYVETDPGQMYKRNYRSTASGNNPRRQEVVRVDYNISPTLNSYFRYIRDNDDEEWPYGSWVSGNLNYDLTNTLRPQRGRGAVVNLTKVFSSTKVNEFTVGASTRGQTFNPVEPEKVARTQISGLGQWYPQSNESGAIPNMTFGGVQNYINPSLGNIPYTNENPVFTWADNFSWLKSSHSLKFGVYIERMRKDEVGGPNTRGSFDFGRNTNNPLDTNYAFSNALLGVFNSYSEGTFRPYSHYRYTQSEWYAQDSWKVNSKLTLDLGLRMYNSPAAHDNRYNITTFVPSLYSASEQARLIWPGKDASGTKVGVDLATGTTYPSPYIGLFVPGSGNYASGMVVGGQDGWPGGLYTTPGISWGPRVGFAYDPAGSGKMVVRGGIGIFYDRPQGNVYSGTNGQPPVAYTPTLYFGTLDTFLQSAGAVGPGSITATETGEQPLPQVYNFSFGIQRQVGFDTVVDVSYVGSLGRSLIYEQNINPIPMYARFDPANRDTTTSSSPLADNFLRPYPGYGNITVRSFGTESNYHSLQIAANRRLAQTIQYGVAYTFSKALGENASDFGDDPSVYFNYRQRNYGLLSYDVTHNLVINYAWNLPNPGQRWGMPALDYVLGHWQISGITSFVSGTPVTPSFALSDGADLTGSSEGARIDVVSDPYLPKGERSFGRNFKTEAFARPAKYSFGNGGVYILRQPSTSNWDISISKRVPFGEERYVQFRTELYNAWNHTEFNGMDTSARFDASGNQIDSNFGALTGARDPRRIQLSLRVMF